MNTTERSDGSQLQALSDRLSNWRDLMERCGRKPTRKRVHSLRVVTLRIQAEVGDELADLPCASREAQAMLRFEKLAGKLRDALGSVRELDVWIGKLRKLRESLSDTTGYVPRSARDTARQIERLESRLTKKRDRSGAKLIGEIENRWDDLRSAARDVEKAIGEGVAEVAGDQASKLLKEFAEIVADFPVFDEENLHEFRKQIKKIRYVAEIHDADPKCARIAAQVKKAQDAIGEWHDWHVLARTAAKGKHQKDVEAVGLLNSMTLETYSAAVATCDEVLRRMADLERDGDAVFDTLQTRPVRNEVPSRLFMKKFA